MSLEAVAKRESSFPDILHQSAPPATGLAGTVRKAQRRRSPLMRIEGRKAFVRQKGVAHSGAKTAVAAALSGPAGVLGRAESALFGKTAGEIRTVMPVQAFGLFKG